MTPGADIYLRRDRTPLQPVLLARQDLAPSLEAAYRALAALHRAEPGRWGGWKLGGTNHASRAAFGVGCGYYGALDRDEILQEPAAAPGFALFEVRGEVEIALRLDAAGGFDAWCVALEMPSSPLRDLPGLGVIALVSDRCAAGALLLGPVQTGPLPDAATARFGLRINGRAVADSGMESLVDTPGAILAEFLGLAQAHGAPLAPGQWVATGGITPCLGFAPGDRVEVTLDGAAVLDVTIAVTKAERAGKETAGDPALQDLRQVLEGAMRCAQGRAPTRSDRKALHDYVTDVDMTVDAYLAGALAALLPGVPVLSEERATDLQGPVAAYWIVDPIDGTLNLIAGVPVVGISVALVDGQGPRLAAVASLGDGVIYLAARGAGAWCGTAGQPLRRLTVPATAPELVVLSSGLLDALMETDGARWAAVRAVGKIRNLGAQSLHLCGVAAGQFAAVGSVEARVWDEAGGGLVVREAGGVWTSAADAADWQSPARLMAIRQQRSLACHPAVAAALSAALQGVLTEEPAGEPAHGGPATGAAE